MLAYFNEKILTLEYVNGYGETVQNRIIQVIDYFKMIDSIKADDHIEVYSRYIIEKVGTTVEDIVNQYYQNQME